MPGYVDASRLLPLHPAAPELRAMDAEIARLTKAMSPPPAASGPIPSPPDIDLPAPSPPPAPEPPDRTVDAERARKAVREEFAVRRLAEPDRAEAAYHRELDRLRRRFAALRSEPQAESGDERLEQAIRYAEQFQQLQRQVKELEDRPQDRLFYTPAQLRRREALYRQTQAEIEELRRERVRELRSALSIPPRTVTTVPESRLAEARERRDRAREQARRLLDELERERLAAVRPDPLPQPDVRDVDPLVEDEPPSTAIVLPSAPDSLPATQGNPRRAALASLRQRRAELRALLLADLRAAATRAGRSRGIVVTFRAGAAPDRTADVAGAVREILTPGLEPRAAGR